VSVNGRRVQAVVGVKALKEQIPEADQRRKEPVVELFILESGESVQSAVRQEPDKEAQELGRSKGRWRRGCPFQGVFLDGM
jgi:hypothetical protein